jgi:hypothetical protein
MVIGSRLLKQSSPEGAEAGRPATDLYLGNGPFLFNNPLLFVIPSEAEGSAVSLSTTAEAEEEH